ncbi:hypothetical protein JMY81_18405 [Brenneria goodwinii]|uniref:hypothetical protein n=1 Tax=Brenneria goodwinii TaxID=1109412 RepID=UPI000EF2470C|nr:hypothetical protein [Brenneria goodwinii]MCG8154924.1 hypothetical protein [Brenneria goodwinii]MCG8162767.1 hypothetical protein [Brenneria goodwinii]MCG8164162.1 hypothetical protein [Brenneria goodwinii]MCG8168771.1 hypothetical protein [Brenneria goodwinii]MCG8173674.1 hypothetical protein [Brenneria goodwinii]
MQTIISAILAFFLFEPFENELNRYAESINMPKETAQQVISCLKSETPKIVEKVQSDLWWTTTAILSIWTGVSDVEQIITEAAPNCVAPFNKVNKLT